jgi:hypothetical protein
MTAFLIILVFAGFAALMIARKMPAILAVPAMAICIAAAAQAPLAQILNEVMAGGATRLAEAYLMVFAGAVLGRVVMQTGIAEAIIKRAAEFGGDQPMTVAVAMMAAVALLFTTLTGLGAIIMVGGLALPIMMSIGVPRKLAGVLFLLAYGFGFIFNIATWGFYEKTLNLDGPAIRRFAVALALIDGLILLVFLFLASRRMRNYGAWAVAMEEPAARRDVRLIALLTPLLPLALHIGLKWAVMPSFLVAALAGVLVTRPRETVRQLSAALVKGLEDVAPAVILMIGIGMLLNATRLPAVQASLQPLIQAIPLRAPLVYLVCFGLLSPLALYRGPLNPYGIGIGVYAIISQLGLLPPGALAAALMSVVQVQTVCDPTNTHNVWVANYVGMRVEELTRETIAFKAAICLLGLVVGITWYL